MYSVGDYIYTRKGLGTVEHIRTLDATIIYTVMVADGHTVTVHADRDNSTWRGDLDEHDSRLHP